jgi:hypothetical protein
MNDSLKRNKTITKKQTYMQAKMNTSKNPKTMSTKE